MMDIDPAPGPRDGGGGGGGDAGMRGAAGGGGVGEEGCLTAAAAELYHDELAEVCSEDWAIALQEGSGRPGTSEDRGGASTTVTATGAAAMGPALADESGPIHQQAASVMYARAPTVLPPAPASTDEGFLKELESVLFADMDVCDGGSFAAEGGVIGGRAAGGDGAAVRSARFGGYPGQVLTLPFVNAGRRDGGGGGGGQGRGVGRGGGRWPDRADVGLVEKRVWDERRNYAAGGRRKAPARNGLPPAAEAPLVAPAVPSVLAPSRQSSAAVCSSLGASGAGTVLQSSPSMRPSASVLEAASGHGGGVDYSAPKQYQHPQQQELSAPKQYQLPQRQQPQPQPQLRASLPPPQSAVRFQQDLATMLPVTAAEVLMGRGQGRDGSHRLGPAGGAVSAVGCAVGGAVGAVRAVSAAGAVCAIGNAVGGAIGAVSPVGAAGAVEVAAAVHGENAETAHCLMAAGSPRGGVGATGLATPCGPGSNPKQNPRDARLSESWPRLDGPRPGGSGGGGAVEGGGATEAAMEAVAATVATGAMGPEAAQAEQDCTQS